MKQWVEKTTKILLAGTMVLNSGINVFAVEDGEEGSEETQDSSGAELSTAEYKVVGVYLSESDGKRYQDDNAALELTEEETDISKYAISFGNEYEWNGSATVTSSVTGGTDEISKIAKDHYVMTDGTLVNFSDVFGEGETVYVVFGYDRVQAEEAVAEETVEPETEEAPETESSESDQEIALGSTFEIETDRVIVTAEATENAKIPADAELHADYIVPGSAKYIATVAAILKDSGYNTGVNKEYELYDIYFTHGEERIEPKGDVNIKMSFKETITPNKENGEIVDANMVHVGTDENNQKSAEILENADVVTTEEGISEVSFTNDSFSPYGIVYTVDYTYDGYTYHMPGGTEMKLSELFSVLGIEKNAADAVSVEFTDYSLLTVTQLEGDWLLTSLQAFDTNETLTVTMSNGDKYVIEVTDTTGGSDLAGFIDGTPIIKNASGSEEVDKEDGAYLIESDEEYQIVLGYRDGAGHHFDLQNPMTYLLPEGFTLSATAPRQGTILIDAGTDSCNLSYVITEDTSSGRLVATFTWPEYDQIPESIKNAATIDFNLSMNGTIDASRSQLDFGGGKTVNIHDASKSEVSVTKTGSYEADGLVHFYVTITSKYGASTGVNVEDTITGTALTLVRDSLKVDEGSASISNISYDNNKFTCSVSDLAKGEKVVLSYTAEVDLSKVGGSGTPETTGNTVKVKSDQYPDGKTENSYANNIKYSSLSKVAGTVGDADADGWRSIPWTITANSERKVALSTISDSITANPNVPMYYDISKPLIINGVEVLWNSVGVTTGTETSWTFNDTTGETKEYVITYYTKANVSSLTEDAVVTNTTTSDKGGSTTGNATVGPTDDNKLSVTKEYVTGDSSYAEWKITINVPAIGMNAADSEVIDTIPWSFFSGAFYQDSIKKIDGALANVTFSSGSDTYEISTIPNSEISSGHDVTQLKISFPNGLAPSTDGKSRTVTIVYQTTFNEDWITAAGMAKWDTTPQIHTNTVKVKDIEKTAQVQVENSRYIKKIYMTPIDVIIDGIHTKAFKYEIELKGIDPEGMEIIDEFDTSLFRPITRQEYGSDDFLNKFTGSNYNPSQKEIAINNLPDGSGAVFSITKEMVDEVDDQDPDHTGKYLFRYALAPKDAEAIARLDQLAVQNGGTYTFNNNAIFLNVESGDVPATYNSEKQELSKGILNESELNSNNLTAEYEIVANKDAYDLNPDGDTVELTDTFTNLSLDYDSIKIYKVENDTRTEINAQFDVTGTTIKFIIPDATKIIIQYDAKIISKNQIKNEVEMSGYKVTSQKDITFDVDSSGHAQTYKIRILKYADANMTVRLSNVQFKLFDADGNPVKYNTGTKQGQDVIETTDANGELTFENIQFEVSNDPAHPIYYYAQEVESSVPAGYVYDATKYSFAFAKEGQNIDYNRYIYSNNDILKIRNKANTRLTIKKEVSGATEANEKEFTVTVKGSNGLYYDADGRSSLEPVDVIIKASQPVTIQNLPVGTYTIQENLDSAKINGYVLNAENKGEATVSLSLENRIQDVTLKNNYSNVIDITVQKRWFGDDPSERPSSVSIKLFQDGVEMPERTVSLLASEGWTYTWEDLPAGHVYTVDEVSVPGYKVTITPRKGLSESGNIIIANTRQETKPGTGEIIVKKEWTGSGDIGNSVLFQLKRKRIASYPLSVVNYVGSLYTCAVAKNSKVNYTYTGGTYTPGFNVKINGEEIASVDYKTDKSYHYQKQKREAEFIATGPIIITIEESNKGGTYQTMIDGGALENEPQLSVTGGEELSEDTDYNNENHTYQMTSPNWSMIIQDLVLSDNEYSYYYYLEEISVDGEQVDASKVHYTNDDGITEGVITIENETTSEVGDLTVSKSVSSAITADASKEFSFTVTLNDTTVNGTYGGMTFTNGVAEFTLANGQSKNATGLAQGITYTVEETADSDFTTTKTGDTGTIGATASTASFTNTRKTGELEISKAVTSPISAEQTANYTFTVTLTNGSQKVSGTYSGYTFDENGQATVTVEGGQSVTISGLPVGTSYAVEETASNDFTVEKSGNTGTISETKSTASFTNTRKTGDLEVSKTVTSSTASDKTKDFSFTVTLGNNTISGTHGEMEFTNGVATFTLKNGEKKTATGLPQGVTYTVEETAADGFVTTKTGDTGTISGTKAVATFTNKRDYSGITYIIKTDRDISEEGAVREKGVQFQVYDQEISRKGDADINKRMLFRKTFLTDGTNVYQWTGEYGANNTVATPITKGDTLESGSNGAIKITGIPVDHILTAIETKNLPGYQTPDVNPATKLTGVESTVTLEQAIAENKAGEFVDTPVTTSLTVHKKFSDGNDKHTSDSVKVTLYKTVDGSTTEVVKITLNADNDWTATWSELQLRDENGNLITYSVKETAGVTGYNVTYAPGDTAVLSGDNKLGDITVNNTKKETPPDTPTPTPTPQYKSVDVTARKFWSDGNNISGRRPNSVTVHLYANGKDTGYTQVLNEANGWTANWYALPLKDENGKFITYDPVEDAVPYYTATVTGDMYKGYTIVNSTHGKVPNTADTFNSVQWASRMIVSMVFSALAGILLRKTK